MGPGIGIPKQTPVVLLETKYTEHQSNSYRTTLQSCWIHIDLLVLYNTCVCE